MHVKGCKICQFAIKFAKLAKCIEKGLCSRKHLVERGRARLQVHIFNFFW